MRQTSVGKFEPIGWDEAFEIIGTRLTALRARHGADAIAIYLGNPIIHNHGALSLRAGFVRAFGTRNSFSAGSQDTSPRFAASFHLYGSSLITPVPDIDRTNYFLCVGANPLVSNGSFMTAPDVRRRLRAIHERGGRIVVVDPRRTETAREADRWVPIRPGGDAALLLAMTQTLAAEGRVDERRIAAVAHGWPEVSERLSAFTPERVAAQTGIAPETIRSLAREFADAPSSIAYSRVGVCNSRFGTLGAWATDVLNLAAGRLGAVGAPCSRPRQSRLQRLRRMLVSVTAMRAGAVACAGFPKSSPTSPPPRSRKRSRRRAPDRSAPLSFTPATRSYRCLTVVGCRGRWSSSSS
jgi:anaerobic selenocysteine-containing dehydrogenase